MTIPKRPERLWLELRQEMPWHFIGRPTEFQPTHPKPVVGFHWSPFLSCIHLAISMWPWVYRNSLLPRWCHPTNIRALKSPTLDVVSASLFFFLRSICATFSESRHKTSLQKILTQSLRISLLPTLTLLTRERP